MQLILDQLPGWTQVFCHWLKGLKHERHSCSAWRARCVATFLGRFKIPIKVRERRQLLEGVEKKIESSQQILRLFSYPTILGAAWLDTFPLTQAAGGKDWHCPSPWPLFLLLLITSPPPSPPPLRPLQPSLWRPPCLSFLLLLLRLISTRSKSSPPRAEPTPPQFFFRSLGICLPFSAFSASLTLFILCNVEPGGVTRFTAG